MILPAHHGGALLLVGVEDDVLALRNIIRVHGHALEVVRSVDGNAHLGVVGATEAELFDSTAHQNDAVHVSSAVLGVLDADSLRGYGSRSLEAGGQYALLVDNNTRSADLLPVGMNIRGFGPRRGQNLENGVVITVGLLDLDVVSSISLSLEGLDGGLQRCR